MNRQRGHLVYHSPLKKHHSSFQIHGLLPKIRQKDVAYFPLTKETEKKEDHTFAIKVTCCFWFWMGLFPTSQVMEGGRLGQGTGNEHCRLTLAPSSTGVTGVNLGGGASVVVGRQRPSKMFPTS